MEYLITLLIVFIVSLLIVIRLTKSKSNSKINLFMIRFFGTITALSIITLIGLAIYDRKESTKNTKTLIDSAYEAISKSPNWIEIVPTKTTDKFSEPVYMIIDTNQINQLTRELSYYELGKSNNGRWEHYEWEVKLYFTYAEHRVKLTIRKNKVSTLVKFSSPTETPTDVHSVIAIDGFGDWLENQITTTSHLDFNQKPQKPKDDRINLKILLSKEEEPDFLSSYDSLGVLSLCCHDKMHLPFNGKTKGDLNNFLKNSNDSTFHEVYENDTSYFTRIYNTNYNLVLGEWEDTNRNYTEKFIRATSYFKDSTIILANKVQIGMTKKAFLNLFFKYTPDLIEQKTTRVSVCSDPRGEDYTKYFFENERLTKITFGDHLD